VFFSLDNSFYNKNYEKKIILGRFLLRLPSAGGGHSSQLSKELDLYGVDGQELRIVGWCSCPNLYLSGQGSLTEGES
jgi:hypothetical protein